MYHTKSNGPFTFFFSIFAIGHVAKICRHCWKEHLKISKTAKLGSRVLKSRSYSFAKSGSFTDISMLGVGGTPPAYKRVYDFPNFHYFVRCGCGQLTNV